MDKEQEKKIKKMLKDNSVSFQDFYTYLRDEDLGFWDGVNDEEIIRQYVDEKGKEGISVSHMMKAIERKPSKEELYKIWLGNSMLTPKPINTKKDLYNALFK